MYKEDHAVSLINRYVHASTEEEVEGVINDPDLVTDSVFDVTASGLAHVFMGIDEQDLQDYFKRTFGFHSSNRLYKTSEGYYAVFIL